MTKILKVSAAALFLVFAAGCTDLNPNLNPKSRENIL